MSKAKLVWKDSGDLTKADFVIDHVGRLNIEVASDLPASGARLPLPERRALALRHAKLLVRSLANELERQTP